MTASRQNPWSRAAIVLGAAWLCGAMLLGPAAAQNAPKVEAKKGDAKDAAKKEDAIDWARAQKLHERAQKGEKLNAEDQAYYDRAREARRKGQGPGAAQAAGQRQPLIPKETTGVKPLTELGEGTYKKQTGGLYGDGHNEPPTSHAAAARKETAKIQPLDAQGQPSPEGKIVLLSMGMSNTTNEFSLFKTTADRDPQKSPRLVIVDAAQGGQAAIQWSDPDSDNGKRVWGTADSRIKAAGVTPQQVQVVWLKQALIQQGQYGEFPEHARKLEAELVKNLHAAKQHFPNLRIAYLSSRIYGGYATGQLNPEPYAFEGAFSVRSVIESQIKRDSKLNFDPDRGPVTSPLVLWGPYLWGDGTTPRKDDGLVWKREDFAGDGTHPSDSGRKKVTDLLLKFFKTDANARTWFLKAA